MEPELLTNTLREGTEIPDSTKTTSTLFFEEGVTCMRINKNVHNFFLMPTPKDGFHNNLQSPEQYEQFFSILGRPGRMRVLLFIYGRKALAFSSSRLAKHMGISAEEAEEILEDLCALKILCKLEIDEEEGEFTYYKALDYCPDMVSLIPFLYASSDFIERAVCSFNNTSETVKSVL